MPYDDFRLDMFHICEGVADLMHQLRYTHLKYAFPCEPQQRLNQFLNEMLVVREMGDYLTQLVFKRKSYWPIPLFFDLETVSLIVEQCVKLQHLELNEMTCSISAFNRLIDSSNMCVLQTLKVGMGLQNYENDDDETVEFDLILRRGLQLKELHLQLDSFHTRPALESAVNHSLTRLSLRCFMDVDEVAAMQRFVGALPTACPQLQDIELLSFYESIRIHKLRDFEYLRSIHIEQM